MRMKGAGKNLFILAIGVAAAIAGVVVSRQTAEPMPEILPMTGQSRQATTQVELLRGDPIPEFAIIDLDGQVRSPAEWVGKVLVINFWATWCPPCRAEIPLFIEYQQRYAEQGLQFVGIALDGSEQVREFAADMQMNYPVLLAEDVAVETSTRFGNQMGALPYTVVFDRQGRVQLKAPGQLEARHLDELVLPLLEQSAG